MKIRQSTLVTLILAGSLLTVMLIKFHPNEKNNELVTHLNEIQKQLTGLKPTKELNLNPLNQDIAKLKLLVEKLNHQDETPLSDLISEKGRELAVKLDALKETVNELNKKENPIKYLPVSALPFQVISIDSIQEVNVATVNYAFKTIPLEKNDHLAGWSVVKLSFSKQLIEFENTNKEHVLVKIEFEVNNA